MGNSAASRQATRATSGGLRPRTATRGVETVKDGQCPKCGSHEIYASTAGPGIGTDNWCWYVKTADSASVSRDDQTLLCTSCGYWENYLRNPKVMADIVGTTGGKNWVKVSPAGWRPDPAKRHELRYWDGTMWTSWVSDAGETSDDPIRPEPGFFMLGD